MIVVGFGLYANTLHNPFVFDDHPSILDNPHIRSLWPLSGALAAPPGSGASGRPVVALSLALNHAVSGLDPWSYHVFNVAMHVLCALVLLSLLRRTLASPHAARALRASAFPLALAVTVLWLVHPLQTAALNHVIYRSEVLVGFFCLLTLEAASRALAAPRRAPWQAIAFAACCLGMASKETMVVVPLLVPLFDATFVSGSWREAWRQRARFYLLLASSWILLAILVAGADRGATVGFGSGRVTWYEYALTQTQVVLTYLRLVFWPQPLVLHYGWEIARSVGAVWRALTLVFLILAATLWALRRRPAAGFAAAWFFLLLAPTSTVLPLTGMVAAEHRPYLALAGPIALTVCGGIALLAGAAAQRTVVLLLLVLLLPVAGILARYTYGRNRDYRSEIVLWQDTVAKRPGNARAHANLAGAFVGEERFEEALAHYREALRLQPGHVETLVHIAGALVRLGRLEEAVPYYEHVLRYEPGAVQTRRNLAGLRTRLATAALDRGDHTRALEHYRAILEVEPDHVGALNNVAWLLATCPDPVLRDAATALASIDRALAVEGRDTPGLLDTRAAALAAAGRFDAAIDTAARARELAQRGGELELSARIEARLQLYRDGRAYRMTNRTAPAPRDSLP